MKGEIAVVSMQDIADKAGVSRVTVSRVLSNNPSVKAETRQKVLHWVKELDYEPNLRAWQETGQTSSACWFRKSPTLFSVKLLNP